MKGISMKKICLALLLALPFLLSFGGTAFAHTSTSTTHHTPILHLSSLHRDDVECDSGNQLDMFYYHSPKTNLIYSVYLFECTLLGTDFYFAQTTAGQGGTICAKVDDVYTPSSTSCNSNAATVDTNTISADSDTVQFCGGSSTSDLDCETD